MDDKKITENINADGWINLLTGMGLKNRDKTVNTKYSQDDILDQATLEGIYSSGGVGKRIVTVPANDMIREWIKIEGDTDNAIIKYLDDKLNIKSRIWEFLVLSKLYGGALAVLGLKDGGLLDEELNTNRLDSIEFIKLYDRNLVTWSPTDLYNDPQNKNYGLPKLYHISTRKGEVINVHESRTLRLDGVFTPENIKIINDNWGLSVLQNCYNQLRDLGSSFNAVAHILDEFIMSVLTVDNLMNLIAQGQEDLISKRLQYMDITKRVSNTTLLDTNEKFDRISASVSGMSELLTKFIENLSAATGIPASLLMGQSPKGLNASGSLEADIKFWYADIKLKQEYELRPILNRIVELVLLSKENPVKGLSEWSIEFLPLWQPSQDQIVETREKQARTDEIYISNGVVSTEEIANSRFGGESYSYDTLLSEERNFAGETFGNENDNEDNKEDNDNV